MAEGASLWEELRLLHDRRDNALALIEARHRACTVWLHDHLQLLQARYNVRIETRSPPQNPQRRVSFLDLQQPQVFQPCKKTVEKLDNQPQKEKARPVSILKISKPQVELKKIEEQNSKESSESPVPKDDSHNIVTFKAPNPATRTMSNVRVSLSKAKLTELNKKEQKVTQIPKDSVKTSPVPREKVKVLKPSYSSASLSSHSLSSLRSTVSAPVQAHLQIVPSIPKKTLGGDHSREYHHAAATRVAREFKKLFSIKDNRAATSNILPGLHKKESKVFKASAENQSKSEDKPRTRAVEDLFAECKRLTEKKNTASDSVSKPSKTEESVSASTKVASILRKTDEEIKESPVPVKRGTSSLYRRMLEVRRKNSSASTISVAKSSIDADSEVHKKNSTWSLFSHSTMESVNPEKKKRRSFIEMLRNSGSVAEVDAYKVDESMKDEKLKSKEELVSILLESDTEAASIPESDVLSMASSEEPLVLKNARKYKVKAPWAKGRQLKELLEAQSKTEIDPESLFKDETTGNSINLEDVFQEYGSKQRYRQRTITGDWNLTSANGRMLETKGSLL